MDLKVVGKEYHEDKQERSLLGRSLKRLTLKSSGKHIHSCLSYKVACNWKQSSDEISFYLLGQRGKIKVILIRVSCLAYANCNDRN